MTFGYRQASARAAAFLAVLSAGAPIAAQTPAPGFADSVLGRWDLMVEGSDAAYPSWLEVRLRTESELMGRFVGRVGSVRHASEVRYAPPRLTFRVPVQYERGAAELEFEGELEGDRIEGTTRAEDGATVRFTAVRAPGLPARPLTWGNPEPLLEGHELTGWRPRSDEHPGCWQLQNGVLAATPPCVDLATTDAFGDFRLHAEVRLAPGSNSGIYLRGRYEIQIQDDAGRALDPLRMGGVYGFIAPSAAAARPAGEWQTFDVELIGRRVSVTLNGTTIISAQEIPGITGGALDSDEARPGPLLLQGDHGAIEFRNLTIARPR